MPELDVTIRETSRCTGDGCGADIWHAISVEGRRVALELRPSPRGTVVLVDIDGRIRAKLLTGAELPAQQEAWVRHVLTCPTSPERQRRTQAAAPKCGHRCGVRMDPWLIEHGYTSHPNCSDPPTLSRGAVIVREALHPPREPEQGALDVDTAAARSWPDRRTPA